MDDLVITTIAKEWTEADTLIARVCRILAEGGSSTRKTGGDRCGERRK